MSFLKKLFSKSLPAEIQTALTDALNHLSVDAVETAVFNDKLITDASFKKGLLKVTLSLPFPAKTLWPILEQQLKKQLTQHPDIDQLEITWQTKVVEHHTQNTQQHLPGVKNIIAVASGKGGVGKSTTAVNLALALQQEGAEVGILDADIYGPSIPTMLGSHVKPETKDGKSMEPITAHGLQLMSIGFLIDENEPMVWRGPIVTQTLTQLLKETNWQQLDYLIIDLPPGTGDIQLTLSQQIPVTGAVIVTTPQEIALIDARKGLRMFEKVNIPVLGIVENMSTHVCSQCGHEEAIFGEKGGQTLAAEGHTKLLTQMPLNTELRMAMDNGQPIMVSQPTSDLANRYRQVAHAAASQIASQKQSYASVFANITVENK